MGMFAGLRAGYSEKGTAMPNSRIHRPNVVTRRATAEPTGVVIRYRGVRPNNNNNNNNNKNNNAALVEPFQRSTLHKLRQLDLYTNTETPNIAHQLDTEAVAVEVTYTMTNTKPSCSGAGESDRVPKHLQGGHGPPSDGAFEGRTGQGDRKSKEAGVSKLVPTTSVPAGHKVLGTTWVFKTNADSTYKGRLVVQGFPQVLSMKIIRNLEKRAIAISRKYYTEDVVQRYGMKGCNPAYNPGIGPELSRDPQEEKLLNELEKRRYQTITVEPYMYFAEATPYGILCAVNQLARDMSKPAKAHMGAAKHLLCHLVESTGFSITYTQGGFRLATFLDANWVNNLENGRSRSSHIVMLANAPIIFKVGLQGLTS